MDKPCNPWAPGTFLLQQSEFCCKNLSASLALAYRRVYLGECFFFSFFYFSGIVLDVPAGYRQKFERKQYIYFWKLMVLCHGTDFLKQKQFSI